MARKMKDSGIEWIGEIPEGWEVIPAKFLFKNSDIRRIADDEQLTSSQQFGIISQKDYTELTGSKVVLANKGLADWKHVEPFDFIISLRSFQGGLEMSEITGCITWHYIVLKSCHKICSYYYKWLFKSDSYIRALQRTCSFIRDGQDLRYSNFIQVPLFEPPLAEQEKIADYLNAECSHIDAMLAKTRSSIEEYKKLKQAVITQAVTKGVRGEREMKDSGVAWIGEIPKYWNIGKLKYYWISVESGVSVNAADRPIDNPAQYGVLKTSSVSKFIFNPHEHKQVNNDEYSRVTCPVTADCIIVSRMNTPDLVGACGYVEKTYPNLFLPDRLWQISFKNDVSAKFIWYYLNNKMVRSYVSSLSTGTSSTMQNISQGQFGNISVCLPDSNEQKEIADYLDAKCAEIDKLIAKKEQLVKELESYKKSLIYEVVTGKREV